MTTKKHLVAVAAASALALTATPAAFATEATDAPANTPVATASPQDETAKTEDGATGSSNSEEPAGSSEEQKAKLQGSSDKFFGWDENTSGLEKFKTIFTTVVDIVKTIMGIPSLGSSK
ncbi:hypothetical protein [uncultured Corynebacterium sp.]|uniref:hypothetical protein n=1 Tax=uncultured Corynebacterium sp. TaxID=159447 RepID=UPI0025E3EAF7|nr:hypothetical protein [uncultured Corynebacterium sp.]